MKVKLDLHTHVWEAFNFQDPTPAMAEQVVARIKDRGIDGIAITDHNNKEWSFRFRDLVEGKYPGEVIIIPGWEIEVRPVQNPFSEYQIAELFLPGGGVVSQLLPSGVLLPGHHHRRRRPRHRNRQLHPQLAYPQEPGD